MINAIKVLITIVVIAFMCFALNLINARKSRRIRQFPLVLISFLLMIVGVALLIENNNFVEEIAESSPFFLQSNLVIINVILMVGFFVVKVIMRPVFCAIFKRKEILDHFSFAF